MKVKLPNRIADYFAVVGVQTQSEDGMSAAALS
jgi:hypothetical protein